MGKRQGNGGAAGSLPRVVVIWILRVLMGLLVLAVAAIAAIPLLLVLDLSNDGTGWGLCPDGMSSCSTSYFAGFEIIGVLALTMFVGLALIAACARLIRWRQRRVAEKRAAVEV